MVSAICKHLLHCTCYAAVLRLMWYLFMSEGEKHVTLPDLFDRYGYLITTLVFLVRLMPMVAVPQSMANLFGILLFNSFTDKVTLKSSTLVAPFLCIRIVTRGDFPDLVHANVAHNLDKCLQVGLHNFVIEVVSDRPLHLPRHVRIRETVVPDEYRTRSGALYKARALQYCLEDGVNILSDDDWIVHLDEETMMTECSVRGIVNFISDGKYHFGQGLITYANGEVVNWLTTYTDSLRVGEDMGKLRFQFHLFHRPLFSWKGSYIVAQVSAERHVTFDHGPVGSIAEDCYFGLTAAANGYLFNFVEGEMWEKSPFTLMDFLRQRRRWIQGTYMVAFRSPAIPLINRIFVITSVCAWLTAPISVTSILLTVRYPVPVWRVVEILTVLITCTTFYLFLLGLVKTLSLQRLKTANVLCSVVGQIVCVPFIVLLENSAIVFSYFNYKSGFHIINKDAGHERVDVIRALYLTDV